MDRQEGLQEWEGKSDGMKRLARKTGGIRGIRLFQENKREKKKKKR
jgi:hypothetical protein